MKDVKISKAGVDAAKQNGLTTNEYIYLCYLSSFAGGNNQRIENIAEIFNVSAILLRQYNAKLRKLELLHTDKYNKLVTEKGKELTNISLRSDRFYFYVKFPFKANLGTMNNNVVYCLVSQMIKNSKQSVVFNEVTYKAYTSNSDVITFFVNQIVSVLGVTIKTARSILGQLIENNYLILNGNYLIDTDFAVIPLLLSVQKPNTTPAQNVKFSVESILEVINKQFNEAEQKHLIELLLNGKNTAFDATEKESNTKEWFYNYDLLDLPILSKENEHGLKNPLHCYLIDNIPNNDDKRVFYSFWENLVKDFSKTDRKNTEYNFLRLGKYGVKTANELIEYIVSKYKDENGLDGVGEFEF